MLALGARPDRDAGRRGGGHDVQVADRNRVVLARVAEALEQLEGEADGQDPGRQDHGLQGRQRHGRNTVGEPQVRHREQLHDPVAGREHEYQGHCDDLWNTQQSSSSAVSLRVVSGNPTAQTMSGPVASGLFKGSTLTVTTMFVAPSGVCTATGLSRVPFKAITVLKIE